MNRTNIMTVLVVFAMSLCVLAQTPIFNVASNPASVAIDNDNYLTGGQVVLTLVGDTGVNIRGPITFHLTLADSRLQFDIRRPPQVRFSMQPQVQVPSQPFSDHIEIYFGSMSMVPDSTLTISRVVIDVQDPVTGARITGLGSGVVLRATVSSTGDPVVFNSPEFPLLRIGQAVAGRR